MDVLKSKILEMVKRLLDKDARPNPFSDNRPGKDWWHGFLRRHPELSLRSPEQLQLARASACSQEKLMSWYGAYEEFLKDNDITDPDQIWNADETGCPLCPKSGRVLAMRGARDLYRVTGNSKEQVTTLCAISAAGSVVPPLHIFAGKRFKIDPMKGCVPNVVMDKSDSGWINTDLFYNWLGGHFIKRTALIRPLVLLIDGHSSHNDLETAKLCKKNDILLYCLPPHSSHITQPLDVGFYGPLKASWKKAVAKYALDNIGQHVTKYTFAGVFREAWEHTVKLSTIVNYFRTSGIWPVDLKAVRQSKIAPSTIYKDHIPSEVTDPTESVNAKVSTCTSSTTSQEKASQLVLNTLEAVLSSATKSKFEQQHEGYDIEDDELYNAWVKLKLLSISDEVSDKNPSLQDKVRSPDVHVNPQPSPVLSGNKGPLPNLGNEDPLQSIDPSQSPKDICEVFKEVLVVPKNISRKTTTRRGGKSYVPPHVSGTEAITLMEKKLSKNRPKKKRLNVKTSVKRNIVKSRKRKKKRLSNEKRKKKRKQKEKEERVIQRPKRGTRKIAERPKHPVDSEDDSVLCPGRGKHDTSDRWVCCDVCDTWFHAQCTTISQDKYDNLENIDWYCSVCFSD